MNATRRPSWPDLQTKRKSPTIVFAVVAAVGVYFTAWSLYAYRTVCSQSGPCITPLFLTSMGLLLLFGAIVAWLVYSGRRFSLFPSP